MINNFLNYVASGVKFVGGFEPMTGRDMREARLTDTKGHFHEKFGPMILKSPLPNGAAERFMLPDLIPGGNVPEWGFKSPFRGFGVPLIGMGITAFTVGSGYSQGGTEGAIQAVVEEVAAGAAMRSALYRVKSSGDGIEYAARHGLVTGGLKSMLANTKAGGFARGARDMATMGRVGLAAYAGAATGGAILGTPGAFAGAYMAGRIARTPYLFGLSIAGAAIGGAITAQGGRILKAGYQKERNRRRIDTAGSTASFMTENAFTQRQRAVSAMQNSHLNARSALGMEATYMHMPRDYFSTYRRF